MEWQALPFVRWLVKVDVNLTYCAQIYYICILKQQRLMAKKYPIGIQDFEELRTSGCYYVDKTALVYDLVTKGKYYFLSRPRRFGKSMLTSTLKAYFLGKRALFDGLSIATLEKDWTEHPVIHIDFTGNQFPTMDNLLERLDEICKSLEAKYGTTGIKDPGLRLGKIIQLAYEKTGKQVVVLVDEYDKPLIDNVMNLGQRERMRDLLSGVYGNLKAMDACLRFGFLTGVSRFSHLSIFSAVNNLNDISFDEKYAGLCGITEDEMDSQFEEDIQEMANNNNLSISATRQQLRGWYDGYRFSPFSELGVYNPFSLLNAFNSGRFMSKWAESGTPTFLTRLVKHGFDLTDVDGMEADMDMLTNSDPDYQTPAALMFQTGYVTIKAYDDSYGIITLGFPNKEVKDAFLKYIVPIYQTHREGSVVVMKLKRDIDEGDVEAFMTRLTAFFSSISYETIKRDYERHYQNLLYTVFYFAGCDVQNEFHTSSGRIDCVVKTKTTIYVFEYKLDGTAEEALAQINEKGYAQPFLSDGRPVVKIGVAFGKDSHTIDSWINES